MSKTTFVSWRFNAVTSPGFCAKHVSDLLFGVAALQVLRNLHFRWAHQLPNTVSHKGTHSAQASSLPACFLTRHNSDENSSVWVFGGLESGKTTQKRVQRKKLSLRQRGTAEKRRHSCSWTQNAVFGDHSCEFSTFLKKWTLSWAVYFQEILRKNIWNT